MAVRFGWWPPAATEYGSADTGHELVDVELDEGGKCAVGAPDGDPHDQGHGQLCIGAALVRPDPFGGQGGLDGPEHAGLEDPPELLGDIGG